MGNGKVGCSGGTTLNVTFRRISMNARMFLISALVVCGSVATLLGQLSVNTKDTNDDTFVVINDGSRLYSEWTGSTNRLWTVSPDRVNTNLMVDGDTVSSAGLTNVLVGYVKTNETVDVMVGNISVGGVMSSTNAIDAPVKAVAGSSQTNLTFWTGSATAYGALAVTNASTIYFITN